MLVTFPATNLKTRGLAYGSPIGGV
jgi:hypothetical protein